MAVTLLLTVGALATHAMTHWHASAEQELQCQACQLGHTIIPQAPPHIVMQPPAPVVMYLTAQESAPAVAPVRDLSVPRAPPA